MVSIINYGIGNLLSVKNAIEYLGYDCMLCSEPEELKKAERLILPGVGAFGDCVFYYKKLGFESVVNDMVLKNKVPILGICVGMQMMATIGHELGYHQGLGWIEGEVEKISETGYSKKIPNVGWENLICDYTNPLFKGLPKMIDFYFVHSFHLKCYDDSVRIARYAEEPLITASINKGNIFGTQFHPEKSADFGLQILDNFMSI